MDSIAASAFTTRVNFCGTGEGSEGLKGNSLGSEGLKGRRVVS